MGLTVLVAFVAMIVWGCSDQGHDVKYVNSSATQLEILIDGQHETTVAAGQTTVLGTLKFSHSMRFVAQDRNGRVFFDKTLSWSDLKALDWTIALPS